MDIIAICGLAILSAITATMIKKYNPEVSVIISIAAGVLILTVVFSKISPVANEISELIQSSGVSSEYAVVLFKTLGICFVCQFTADACKDAGESAVASKVEFAGRVTILIIALPLFQNIAETATSLIGG